LIGPDARSPFTAGVCVTTGGGEDEEEEEEEIFTVVVVETSSFRTRPRRRILTTRRDPRCFIHSGTEFSFQKGRKNTQTRGAF
jgi:hypothetical protein